MARRFCCAPMATLSSAPASSKRFCARVQLAFLGELAHLAVGSWRAALLTEEELATFAGDRSFPARPWEYFLSRIGERRVS